MIQGLKPYPAYKDSGVPWLGEVPEHWEVRRLKSFCRFTYGDALPTDARRDGDVFVYGSNGRVGNHAAANTQAPCIVIGRKGSFGKVNFSLQPVFAIDTTYYIDSRTTSVDIRWLYHLLGWLRLDEVSRDSAIPGLDREEAYQNVSPVPPLAEQSGIVRFLGHVDRKIQRAIRAKQRLVKLLEEEKQVLIHRAVTGQIDVRTGKPYPAYKDSGVEWLGDVPEDWTVVRLKAVTTPIEQGWSPQCFAQPAGDHEWGVLKVGCVNRDSFDESQNKKLPSSLAAIPKLEIQNGDILISRANTRELLGLAALAVNPRRKLILCDKLFRLKAKPERSDPRFLVYALRQKTSRSQIESNTNGASDSMQNIGQAVIRNLFLAMPPLSEQRGIVKALETQMQGLSIALGQARGEISFLREYRTRLVTDVVTGKLDVREAAANLPDESQAEVAATEPEEDLDLPQAAEEEGSYEEPEADPSE